MGNNLEEWHWLDEERLQKIKDERDDYDAPRFDQRIKFAEETSFQANTRHIDNVVAGFGNSDGTSKINIDWDRSSV